MKSSKWPELIGKFFTPNPRLHSFGGPNVELSKHHVPPKGPASGSVVGVSSQDASSK